MLPQELTIPTKPEQPVNYWYNNCSPLLLKFGILMVVTWEHPKIDENDHASTVNYVDLAMQCVNE